MANKKSKFDHGVLLAVLACIPVIVGFFSVLPEMIGFALVGGGGLITGTAGWMATSEVISIFRTWSDPGR
jgi:hypothetical protein